MKKRILTYRKRIDDLLNSDSSVNWNDIMEEHLRQISFFQHERLVHLIVTMTFAVLTMLALGMGIISGTFSFFLLTIVLLILLIPYIMHYYLLENEVQKMYIQYDRILALIRSNASKDF